MEIPEVEIDRLRRWVKERNSDPEMNRLFEEHREKEPERVVQLRDAAVSFVGGGGLGEFADGYVGPFNAVGGWDYTLLKDMAEHLANETEVVDQCRRSCQAPDSDQEAVTRINEFAELIQSHVKKGSLDKNKSHPGYAPLVLAACWHAQVPASWQPYSGKAFRALRKCAPTVCGRYTHGRTHGERCLGFEQSLRTLATAVEIEPWDLALTFAWRRFVDAQQPDQEPPLSPRPPEPGEYGLAEAAGEIFMGPGELERLLGQLKRKKNLVLQGPPGTGKTFVAQRLAWLLTKERISDRLEAVQFHQSYGYEDFVRGFRPTIEGGFELRDGPFLRFCDRARADRERPFVLLIDEINRGNLSRIFGELLMLIEADKRSSRWAVRLAYPRDGEGRFHVPDNVYLIGTMNTADRSLALVDYALRRRFAFGTIGPAFGTDGFMRHLLDKGAPESLRLRIGDRFNALNQTVADNRDLGPGFRIGHSYFCEPHQGAMDDWEGWYREIVEYEIKPLLEEYWFDKPDEAEKRVAALLADD